MDKIFNSVMSMKDFKIGQLETPQIEGLLLRSDENGVLSIGIPINAEEVAIVAYSTMDEVFEKMMFWADKVEQVKEEYSAKAS